MSLMIVALALGAGAGVLIETQRITRRRGAGMRLILERVVDGRGDRHPFAHAGPIEDLPRRRADRGQAQLDAFARELLAQLLDGVGGLDVELGRG